MTERCCLCCSRRACGLVGIVGLFSTSLWASRYIVRRLLGYYMCGGTNWTIFFHVKSNFQKEQNGRFITCCRLLQDYWTDDAIQQCFAVVVRWYDVLKTRKKLLEPSFGGSENTRCRICLDELSRTCTETTPRRVVWFLCVHGTRGDWPWRRVRWVWWIDVAENNVDLHKHTHTYRESRSRHPTLVFDPI